MKNTKELRIGVFRGGVSPERDISLVSGKYVLDALQTRGYTAIDVILDTSDRGQILDLVRINNIDIVFIALHGVFGEDGGIQEIFEQAGIPFTGSGSKSSRQSMDKIATRVIFKQHQITYPEYWLYEQFPIPLSADDFPLVVKPHNGGSSIGISIVNDESSLNTAIESALKISEKVLIDRYIKGRELTIGLLNGKILPIVEIVCPHGFYDFAHKYEDPETQFLVPARLPEDVTSSIQQLAQKAFSVLECRHFARVDLRIDDEQNPFILEVNTIPGFTSHSLLPLAAQHIGLDFGELCELIIQMSFNEKRKT